MLLRTVLLVAVAAVLLAVSSIARACPGHSLSVTVVSITSVAPEITFDTRIDEPICHTGETCDNRTAPCNQFHLCCVTPVAITPAVVETTVLPAARGAVRHRPHFMSDVKLTPAAPPPRS